MPYRRSIGFVALTFLVLIPIAHKIKIESETPHSQHHPMSGVGHIVLRGGKPAPISRASDLQTTGERTGEGSSVGIYSPASPRITVMDTSLPALHEPLQLQISEDLLKPGWHGSDSSESDAGLNCPTPMSLMLHGNYGVERMQALADGILTHGLQAMTYREILEYIDQGECPPRNAIIVSLDDISIVKIDPVLKRMIAAFTERGLALVLGVVTRSPAESDAWAYLQGLDMLGVEIASHTSDHIYLAGLGSSELDHQITGSYQRICEHLGKCPVSLILPYGSLDASGNILQHSHRYTFIVGIAGGLRISGGAPHYVGRSGPNTDSLNGTLETLKITYTP